MSNDNDNIFKSLQQFIEKYGHEFDSIEEAMDTFMQRYNQEHEDDSLNTPQTQSKQLLQASTQVHDIEKQELLLKQAVQLWPENWDAHSLLITGNAYQQLGPLIQLEEEAFQHWQALDMGSWADIDARPYYRLKYRLLILLSKQGLLPQAIQHMEEFLDMDELDALGIRYHLMAAYCRVYDWNSAIDLFNQLPYDGREDDRLVLMLLILAIVTDKETYAMDLMQDLLNINNDIELLLKENQWPLAKIISYSDVEEIRPRTFDTLAITLIDILPLIMSSEYALHWMKGHYQLAKKHRRVNVSDKVISFRNAHLQRNEKYRDDPIFDDIVHNAFHALIDNGYKEIKDFIQVTEEELLKMKHIGPKTIQQLKTNGVTFKES